MIYAAIDVNIISHHRALEAGLEAFGLWTWGMCYAQTHASNGRLPRIAVLCAFGGRRNVMLAKRLVEVGLWVANEDGSWGIGNYVRKNQTAEEIEARRLEKKERNAFNQRESRERRKALSPPVTEMSSVTVTARSPRVTGKSLSLSPPLSDQIPPKPPEGADEVWEHYIATAKKHRPKRRPTLLTPKDRKAIQGHLKHGLTVADLKRAVEGLFRSPHHLGMNDRSTDFLELEYALRKPATFIALADDVVPVAEPVTQTRPVAQEFVDPALIDAELAKLDARFAS